MTEELVTIVRRRIVYAEVVIPRSQFDEMNFVPVENDIYGEAAIEALNKFHELPFEDWDDAICIVDDDDFDTFMVFQGDVSGGADDLVSVSKGCWQDEPPFTVDPKSYMEKLLE